jgi:hypothetical protein
MHTHEYPKTLQELAENRWIEVTEDEFDQMLEILPPEHWDGHSFAVGEPLCMIEDGRQVFMCYCTVKVDGVRRFFKLPEILDHFNTPAWTNQIRAQFKF